MKQYYVYILSNLKRNVLYIGITNDVKRRVYEHRNGLNENAFTSKYNCEFLMLFEAYASSLMAINREKQLKNWHKDWKWNLIKETNPNLEDLAKDWFEE